MTNEADPPDTGLTVLDVVHDLRHQLPRHVLQVLEGVGLVDLGHQKVEVGEARQRHFHVGLYQSQVSRVTWTNQRLVFYSVSQSEMSIYRPDHEHRPRDEILTCQRVARCRVSAPAHDLH